MLETLRYFFAPPIFADTAADKTKLVCQYCQRKFVPNKLAPRRVATPLGALRQRRAGGCRGVLVSGVGGPKSELVMAFAHEVHGICVWGICDPGCTGAARPLESRPDWFSTDVRYISMDFQLFALIPE